MSSGGIDAAGGTTMEPTVIHIPQTEKVYTVYEQDSMGKLPDRYAIQWQSYATGRVRDISDRVTAPHADRRQRQRVHGSFPSRCRRPRGEVLPPLEIQPGDLVSCVNTSAGECVFFGQVQRGERLLPGEHDHHLPGRRAAADHQRHHPPV